MSEDHQDKKEWRNDQGHRLLFALEYKQNRVYYLSRPQLVCCWPDLELSDKGLDLTVEAAAAGGQTFKISVGKTLSLSRNRNQSQIKYSLRGGKRWT
jgi:hypothetical protein